MARNIGADGSDVYRAVITITDAKTGKKSLKYEGPYSHKGSAQGRITFWENYFTDYDDDGRPTGSRATGVVERAQTVWVEVGDDSTPATAPGRPVPLDTSKCPSTCPRRTIHEEQSE